MERRTLRGGHRGEEVVTSGTQEKTIARRKNGQKLINKMKEVLRVQRHGGSGDHSDRNLSRGMMQGAKWEEGNWSQTDHWKVSSHRKEPESFTHCWEESPIPGMRRYFNKNTC